MNRFRLKNIQTKFTIKKNTLFDMKSRKDGREISESIFTRSPPRHPPPLMMLTARGGRASSISWATSALSVIVGGMEGRTRDQGMGNGSSCIHIYTSHTWLTSTVKLLMWMLVGTNQIGCKKYLVFHHCCWGTTICSLSRSLDANNSCKGYEVLISVLCEVKGPACSFLNLIEKFPLALKPSKN